MKDLFNLIAATPVEPEPIQLSSTVSDNDPQSPTSSIPPTVDLSNYYTKDDIDIKVEINFDKIDKVRGMDIVICTSARNNSDAFELLKSFNLPFKGNLVN